MADQRRRKYNTPIYGNLAYDLDTLARERELEEAGRVQERHRRAQEVQQPRRAPQVRPRQRVSVLTLGGVAVLVAMVAALLIGYVQLTEISASVSALKAEISQLEDEHVGLLTRYEQTFDLATIKETAEAAGMSKPSSGQIEYVDLAGADTAVVYRADAQSALGHLADKLGDALSAVVEYFQ